MGVGALAKKIFTTDERNAAAVVQASWIRKLEADDQVARDEAQRFLDWYHRDKIAIVEHLKEQAKRSFDKTSDWQFPIINGVPRTIRRISTAYRQAPVREYIRDDKPIEKGSKELKNIALMFSKIDINRKMRAFDRLSSLLNTIHVETVFRKEFIDWDARLRPDVTVLEDPEDFLEFLKFAYKWEPMDPDSLQPKPGWVYWSDDQHVFITAGGMSIGMSNEEGTNPYRDEDKEAVIPVTTIRKLEDIPDYWGRFGADLVESFQTMNIQLGNIWETVTLQVHGQPLFINLSLESGAKVKQGPKHPLVAKDVTKDDVAPDVKYPKPEPDIKETQEFLDWYIKATGAAYGMPPSAWSMDEARISGFAKWMDNLELSEEREENATRWQDIENDLYRRSAIVWNTWRDEKVPTDVEVRVTFPDEKIPETPKESTERWALKIASGQASLVEMYMEEEGLDEKEALAKALKVAAQNKELRAASTPEPTETLPTDNPASGGDE